MAQYEIPLTPEAQSFSVNLAGVDYKMSLWWSSIANCWNLDIFNKTGSAAILTSIPVVANTNLLSPYGYMNFGGSLIAQTDTDLMVAPTYENLGSTGHIYFITP